MGRKVKAGSRDDGPHELKGVEAGQDAAGMEVLSSPRWGITSNRWCSHGV